MKDALEDAEFFRQFSRRSDLFGSADDAEVVGEGNDPIEPDWPSTATAIDRYRQQSTPKRTIWDNPEVQRYYRWLARQNYRHYLDGGQLKTCSPQLAQELRDRVDVTGHFAQAAQHPDTPRRFCKLHYDQPNPCQSELRTMQYYRLFGLVGLLIGLMHCVGVFFTPTQDLLRWFYWKIFHYYWHGLDIGFIYGGGAGTFFSFYLIAICSDHRNNVIQAWEGTPLFGNTIYAHYNDDLSPREPGVDPLGFHTVKGPLGDYHGRSPYGDASTASTEQAQRGMKGRRDDASPRVRN